MATTKNIQSVERAFAILESFQQSDDGERSVKEISEALGLNKSTAFGLINTLTDLGYLQQNEKNQKYYLGLKLLNFSNIIKVQNRIIRIVHPYLEQVSRKYGETAHCAVKRNDAVVYVDKVESTGSITINTHIGTQNYMHCSGVGKCILAYLPAEEQERILSGPLVTKTFNTITNSEQLREEIRKVREQGYATDNEEDSLGLSCVAIPVFSASLIPSSTALWATRKPMPSSPFTLNTAGATCSTLISGTGFTQPHSIRFKYMGILDTPWL